MIKITPSDLAEWFAWAGVVAPLGALAFAAIRHVMTEAGRSRRAQDERLQELAKIIYNQGGAFGLGAQLLAIDELRRFRKRKAAMKRYVDVLRRDYVGQNAASELIAALDDLEKELKN